MPKRGQPIDPQIKCPKCGAIFPLIKHNGYYKRDNYKIPQFFCEKCNQSFSASVIKICILKPPVEIETNHRIKVEAKVESLIGQGIKDVEFEMEKNENSPAISFKLTKDKNDAYKGIWDAALLKPGTYKTKIIATDMSGYVSIQPKTVSVKEHFEAIVNPLAKKEGIDALLIKAIIKKESSFNPEAKSKAGAIGLMQLMPITSKEYKVKNLQSPYENVSIGIKHFKKGLKAFNGDIRLALAGYNAGITKIKKRIKNNKPWPHETQDYVIKVMKYWDEFKREADENYLQ